MKPRLNSKGLFRIEPETSAQAGAGAEPVVLRPAEECQCARRPKDACVGPHGRRRRGCREWRQVHAAKEAKPVIGGNPEIPVTGNKRAESHADDQSVVASGADFGARQALRSSGASGAHFGAGRCIGAEFSALDGAVPVTSQRKQKLHTEPAASETSWLVPIKAVRVDRFPSPFSVQFPLRDRSGSADTISFRRTGLTDFPNIPLKREGTGKPQALPRLPGRGVAISNFAAIFPDWCRETTMASWIRLETLAGHNPVRDAGTTGLRRRSPCLYWRLS